MVFFFTYIEPHVKGMDAPQREGILNQSSIFSEGLVKEEYFVIILGYFFLFFFIKSYVVGTHYKHLSDTWK